MPFGQLYPARLCRLCRCQPAPPPAPKGQADTTNSYPKLSAHTAGGEFSESFSLLPPPVPPWGRHCSRGDSMKRAGHTLGVASLRTSGGLLLSPQGGNVPLFFSLSVWRSIRPPNSLRNPQSRPLFMARWAGEEMRLRRIGWKPLLAPFVAYALKSKNNSSVNGEVNGQSPPLTDEFF